MFFRTPMVEPTPEVVDLLREAGLSPRAFPWFDTPALNPAEKRISIDEVSRNRVEILELLDPFLGNKILTRSIRTWDLLTGCFKNCPTCLAKSALPSAVFSYEGIVRAFNNRYFLNMLQPDSLRNGSSGDSLDHPDAPAIFALILEQTRFLDEMWSRHTKGKERHHVKSSTNFRPNNTDLLDDLISLALANPERFSVRISLPLTKNDAIHEAFAEYARTTKHRKLFKVRYGHVSTVKLGNIYIQDVANETSIWKVGRIPDESYLRRLNTSFSDGSRPIHYEDRGLVKIYLNPDALWLFIYGTLMESSTTRIFTPLTSENLDLFSLMPFHGDFPTPPNWLGGRGDPYDENVAETMFQNDLGKKQKPLTIIK